MGGWKSYSQGNQPPTLRPLKHGLNHEDTGSKLNIPLKNRTTAAYCIEKGEAIAMINFEQGDYCKTSIPYQDPCLPLPYVCCMKDTAKRPELVEVVHRPGGVGSSWQMYSSEDVTIPPLEDRVVRTGVGFAFRPDLIGQWINYPLVTAWTPTFQSFKTSEHWKGTQKTAKVRVQNMTKDTITIRAHSTVAILRFVPRIDLIPYIDLDPEATVCCIDPGAKVSRATPHTAWSVHPMDKQVIFPHQQAIVPTGVTFHIPEGRRGVWESQDKTSRLTPALYGYIKDPEVLLRNDTSKPITIYPWDPIARVKLIPDLRESTIT